MRNRSLCILCAAFLLTLAPLSYAAAFCSEPSTWSSPPSAPGTYLKPSTPYCMADYSYTREHTCDSWEINGYIDDVNEYIRRLNNFADEAREYADNAISFSNEASDYALCEANDAKSELE